MNPLLSLEIQDFINLNINADIQKLSLQKNPFPNTDYKEILNQIETKAKSKLKLPTWFTTQNIIYPSKISVEQTSSETTALYKSKLIQGKSIIDLTGGFGIDAYYFAKQFQEVVHCELDAHLSEIVQHNFKTLQVDNIKCYPNDGLEVLKTLNRKFDWIYIDPSRRSDIKGKVFLLRDCLPDTTTLIDEYLNYSDKILVKCSPIYDISAGLSELKFIKNIHILSVDNQVKELLFEIDKTHNSDNIHIKTANISIAETACFDFVWGENALVNYTLPQKYLYEPNAAVMKSQGFDQVSNQFGVNKLHQHSHLYTSEQRVDFVGRRFEIKHVIPYKKTTMKEFLQGKKANITIRNFPESVAQLRERWKIADGSELYCFFTTNLNNEKIVVICNKI
jgi:predicted transposase YbfD/YdcC